MLPDHFVEHPEIWPEMGKAGRDYVKKHYDIQKLNDRLVEMFQSLLEGTDNSYLKTPYTSGDKMPDMVHLDRENALSFTGRNAAHRREIS